MTNDGYTNEKVNQLSPSKYFLRRMTDDGRIAFVVSISMTEVIWWIGQDKRAVKMRKGHFGKGHFGEGHRKGTFW